MLDLFFPLEIETEVARTDASGYHFVPFSYGNSAESCDQKNPDVVQDTSVFHPPFSVPESLLQNLMLGAEWTSSDLWLPFRGTLFPFDPPSEKVHQIIARTALFVGEHGGQSEIILRVKQGDNPTFGFLMPNHHLHPYFRYLVDHYELLKADHDGKPQEKTNEDQTGGALSLLGSVYGTGEDEDVAAVVDREAKQVDSDETSAVNDMSRSHQIKQITSPRNVVGKDKTDLKLHVRAVKKDEDIVAASTGPVMDKSKASSLFPVPKVETLIVDPPSEIKRLVDRIVEIILKNGKDFEAVLIEQDKKHGRFPFLLPSNQYHQYYLKVLKKAQESRLNCKSFNTEKDVFPKQGMDKNTKEGDISPLGSEDHDYSLDCDKKEKFKMVIGKLKKDTQDYPSKETQQQSTIT
ncbi:Splicing factor suppressor of white-apricot-like protein, partial [Bienertia sinuspersici]